MIIDNHRGGAVSRDLKELENYIELVSTSASAPGLSNWATDATNCPIQPPSNG